MSNQPALCSTSILTSAELDLLRSLIPYATGHELNRIKYLLTGKDRPPLATYRDDPVGYATDVLGVKLWSKQAEILASLLKPPYRTLVKSSHSIGKSFTAAVATSWWFDTHDPGVVITTAPTARDVRDVLWKEIRVLRQRAGLGDFAGNEAPILKTSPDHYAKGYTAAKGESFQGRHDLEMLFVFDEAVGVSASYWITTRTMWKPEPGMAWLAICNPTDTTSQAYQEDQGRDGNGRPTWNVITVSAFDHPNIAAQLRGEPPPYPSAVTLAQLEEAISEGCDRV